MKNNLVFLPDSNYSEVIVSNFEKVAPGKSIYVCFTNNNIHLKNEKVIFVGFSHFGKFKGDLSFLDNKYERVFFNLNSLFSTQFYYKYIDNKANFITTKLVFMFWSGELYNHPAYKNIIYDKHSLKYKTIYKRIFSSKPVDKFLNLFDLPSYSKYYKLNAKMDFFCGFLESEHKIYNHVFNSNSKFVLFTFLNLELLKLPENVLNIQKNDVLIGNSGSIENNHFEILQYIKNVNPGDYGIIFAPLSYGHHKYLTSIIEIAKEYLGDKFYPITSFLSREEYNNKISEVKVAIFNHYIQQAMGNIFFMLYLGARIYFNRNNPLYEGFVNSGFIVNCLDEFEIHKLNPLKVDEIAHNQNLLVNFLNKDASYNYYKTILEIQ